MNCLFLSLSLIAAVFCLTSGSDSDEAPILCGDVGASSLKMIILLTRHGDRTPKCTYPNDPHQEDAWAAYGGFGQMTQRGFRQTYQLGRWVRQCYSNFLSKTYSPDLLKVISTEYDRTITSAQAQLSGCYPPVGHQVWTRPGYYPGRWQPIPVHTTSFEDDYLLNTVIDCPAYEKLYKHYSRMSDHVQQVERKYRDILLYISDKAGIARRASGELFNGDMYCLLDAVFIEREHNMKLPSWMTPKIQQLLDEWHHMWLSTSLASKKLVHWQIGSLIAVIQDTFRNKAKGLITQQEVLYAAHDANLAPLLYAYGSFNNFLPPLASMVITELHKDPKTKKYFVRAFYRNETTSEPFPLKVKGCGTPCYLDKFIEALNPFRMADKKAACYDRVSNKKRSWVETTFQGKNLHKNF